MSTTPKTLGQMVEEIIQAKRDQEAEWRRLAEADQQLQATTLWTVPDLVEALAHGRVHIAPGHDPALTAPTTAQEALDLAWNLAYPVNEGQTIPTNTEYLLNHGLGYNLQVSIGDRRIDSIDAASIRTLDPLPDPPPDWLDAPAVIAVHETHYSVPSVWVPHLHQKGDWTNAITGKTFPWQELTDATPLHPKEDTPHDTPSRRTFSFHDDRPWGTRLGGDPA